MIAFKITRDPSREEAQHLLESSQGKVLRGVRDGGNGCLYLWDATESQHAGVIEALGLAPEAERLMIDSMAEVPEGVFFGETDYGQVVFGHAGAAAVQDVSENAWQEAVQQWQAVRQSPGENEEKF